MKIRHGFVSNSSSSSFICQICGEEASGWDLSLSNAEMAECEHGHTFCLSHLSSEHQNLSSKEQAIILIKREIPKLSDLKEI